MEPVVVDKNSIKVLVEKFRRQWPFKTIVPYINVLEGGQIQYNLRERSNEAIVTYIELLKKF